MSEKIEPVQSAEEWRDWSAYEAEERRKGHANEVDDKSACLMIATLNARLSDDNPRKITRAMINRLRDAAYTLRGERGSEDENAAELDRDADALESYLPPEQAP